MVSPVGRACLFTRLADREPHNLSLHQSHMVSYKIPRFRRRKFDAARAGHGALWSLPGAGRYKIKLEGTLEQRKALVHFLQTQCHIFFMKSEYEIQKLRSNVLTEFDKLGIDPRTLVVRG